MKGSLTNEQFYTLCLLITQYCEGKFDIDQNIWDSVMKINQNKKRK